MSLTLPTMRNCSAVLAARLVVGQVRKAELYVRDKGVRAVLGTRSPRRAAEDMVG